MLLWAFAIGSSTALATVAPACDISKGADEVCEDFCNYRCGFYNESAGETGRLQNVTVYRITPTNISGPRNHNLADPAGDIGYWLTKKNMTQLCAQDPEAHGCLTDGQNMYGMFTIQTDGQWGTYSQCNPTNMGGSDPIFNPIWKDSRNFQCGQDYLLPTATGCHSWDTRPPKNGSDGIGLACYCDSTNRHNLAPGRAAPEFLAGRSDTPGKVPASWVPQCQSGYASTHGCLMGEVSKTITGWSFESALAMACEQCRDDANCSGWSTKDNRTVHLFRGNVTTAPGTCTGAKASLEEWDKQKSWFGVGALGGLWYSTLVAGECAKGAAMGTAGCTWREVASSYRNASCVDSRVDASVEEYAHSCFAECGTPLNRTSDCYLECYRDSLMGNAGTNVTQIPHHLIMEPWVRGFDDPKDGGCPELMPDPCEGPQCDPLVPSRAAPSTFVI